MDWIKKRLIPHLIGLIFIFFGWFITIGVVGWDKFSRTDPFTKGTLFGLILILIGAYLPEVWMKITNKD
jgi:multisubunit Na+/H+ antiporter MnhG subunit